MVKGLKMSSDTQKYVRVGSVRLRTLFAHGIDALQQFKSWSLGNSVQSLYIEISLNVTLNHNKLSTHNNVHTQKYVRVGSVRLRTLFAHGIDALQQFKSWSLDNSVQSLYIEISLNVTLNHNKLSTHNNVAKAELGCKWWHMARFWSRDITNFWPADVHLGVNFK